MAGNYCDDECGSENYIHFHVYHVSVFNQLGTHLVDRRIFSNHKDSDQFVRDVLEGRLFLNRLVDKVVYEYIEEDTDFAETTITYTKDSKGKWVQNYQEVTTGDY